MSSSRVGGTGGEGEDCSVGVSVGVEAIESIRVCLLKFLLTKKRKESETGKQRRRERIK